MLRLVFSDLDSTLIWREDHVITLHALDAIRTLRAAGIEFVPCTGRVYRDLPAMFAGDAEVCQTAVTGNGHLTYAHGALIDAVVIPHEALEALFEALIPLSDAYLVVEYEGEKVGVGVSLDYVLANPDNFWRVERVLPCLPQEPCYKANIRVVGTYSRCRDVAQHLMQRCPSLELLCPMPGTPHIDVVPRGMGKDHGAQVLMEYFDVTPEETCFFCDAENDVPLARMLPHSVAVATGSPELLAVARYRVGPAHTDSVADSLLEIVHKAQANELPKFLI